MLREGTRTAFVDVDQDGDTVSFTYDGAALTGTVSAEGQLRMTGSNPPSSAKILDGDVSSDGKLLSAAVLSGSLEPPTFPTTTYLFGWLCGCSDGNTTAGDGCDAECQVEPCWTCSVTPPACTPAADGAACESGPCISDSTCQAGVCTGGNVITPCVDMGGAWAVDNAVTSSFTAETQYEHYHETVQQRGTNIIVAGRHLGMINPATGSIGWTMLGSFYGFGLCGDEVNVVREEFSGTVAADGSSFAARGVRALYISRCPLADTVTEIAVRNEAQTCGPDGATCSRDLCHIGESCLDDVCQGGDAMICSAGEHCEGVRGCVGDSGLGCPGDCNGDGHVMIDELTKGTIIALEQQPLAACLVFDRDFDQRLRIEELVKAVRAALAGC